MGARLSADFLIIGSGIAGLRAACALADRGRVVILTKATASAGNTGYAQGGIAAAVGPDDSPPRHAADTLAAGDGLCDVRAVTAMVEAAPGGVRELIEWGAAFDRTDTGALSLAREGAHSARRVLHARDATGREIGRVLASRIAGHASVRLKDHALVVRPIIELGKCVGVWCLDETGALQELRANATLIATGGAGYVFRETTNPEVATGDGVAMAYHAGARVTDLEFMQFHPTALAVRGAPRYLLSEALRGEGARLVNAAGEAFMTRYDSAGELAARDRVARALVLEMRRTSAPVYLSMAHLPPAAVHARFPLVAGLCRRVGLDLASDPIPVGPAAHYSMGGIATDLDGRTSIAGLFAAGEVACTGVHGANRLASNSLLEGLVFGARAGAAMGRWRTDGWPGQSTGLASQPPAAAAPVELGLTEAGVRDLMWEAAGIFRDRAGLERAMSLLTPAVEIIESRLSAGQGFDAAGWRLASLVTVGRLMAQAALRREESRGAHARTDFPARDDLHWSRHVYDGRDPA